MPAVHIVHVPGAVSARPDGQGSQAVRPASGALPSPHAVQSGGVPTASGPQLAAQTPGLVSVSPAGQATHVVPVLSGTEFSPHPLHVPFGVSAWSVGHGSHAVLSPLGTLPSPQLPHVPPVPASSFWHARQLFALPARS